MNKLFFVLLKIQCENKVKGEIIMRNQGSYEAKLRRNIILDYFHITISNMSMQSSIWVLYLAYCGMNLMQIGLLEGIYHVTSMIFEIPSGAIADLLGRKKSMLISQVLIAISCILMLGPKSFYVFALSFFIQAIGNNFTSGSEEALVYDSMKEIGEEERYIHVNGRINMIIEGSQASATVIGGILAEYSYVACYMTSVVIMILALIPILLMTEPVIRKEESQREELSFKRHFQLCFSILKSDVRIFKIIVYFSAIFATNTLLFFYSQQYFYDFGCNKIGISIIMFFSGLASCLGAITSAALYKRFGIRLAKVGAGIIAVSIACFGLSNFYLAIGAFMISNYFNSMLYPIQSNSLNQLIPSEQRATLISVNSMFFSISMVVVFPVVGALADSFGLPITFFGLGILLFAGAIGTMQIKLE